MTQGPASYYYLCAHLTYISITVVSVRFKRYEGLKMAKVWIQVHTKHVHFEVTSPSKYRVSLSTSVPYHYKVRRLFSHL